MGEQVFPLTLTDRRPLVALGLGEVSVVAPLARTAPLFVLPFTPLFLKGVERLTGRIIGGAILHRAWRVSAHSHGVV
jgi:hypothetical protein